MRISVIGLGKLGLCTACCLARAGLDVVGADIDETLVDGLEAGRIPFFEPGLEELFDEVRGRMRLTTDCAAAARDTDATFIIVPTPSEDDGSFSNAHVVSVLECLVPVLAAKDRFHVVNVVSTVMPGSCENGFLPLLEEGTGLKAGRDFGLAYNPEFIAIGSVIKNFLEPDLVLIGESDPRTGAILEAVYRATCDNEPHIARLSLLNAEITKLSINCYCTMKISFANNLASLCEKLPGADAAAVTGVLGHDTRIGHKYIRPGLGFGGPCFPRDNEAFIRFADDLGGYSGLQRAVVEVNDSQIDRSVDRVRSELNGSGGKVAVLGLSYKPDTYLTERSQAEEIAQRLAREFGLDVCAFDPLARTNGAVKMARSTEECVADADVVLVLTPWPQFMKEECWRPHLREGARVINMWK